MLLRKAPTELERKHDFLWRIHKEVPEKGMIKVFNRSHYEDVLITRVEKWIDDAESQKRFTHINNFEKLISEANHTIILKFYLHISKEEQLERLQERIDDPTKNWKYNANDLKVNENGMNTERYTKMLLKVVRIYLGLLYQQTKIGTKNI